MRIATWNVNGLRARLDYVRRWLDARQPDIVGLQELKLSDDLFPHDELAELGYRAAVYGQKAWNGVAILARSQPTVLQVGLPGQEDFGSRLLTAEVEGITFTTVYCPNGKNTGHEDFPKKLAWFAALRDHLAATQSADVAAVVCGDFNICPTGLDSWNEDAFHGEIFHTDAERERYAALLDWGLDDLYRQRHPDTREFSWWDYRGGSFHRGQGLRIDHLLATAPVVARLQSVVIDRDWRKKVDDRTPSDHAPVVADLD